MFFFIGGVQPKTVKLEDRPRLCQSCGLYQAHLKRVDHYISVFFLPLFPVKKGTPFVQCDRCGAMTDPTGRVITGGDETGRAVCPYCGGGLRPEFRYCPSCGKRTP